MSFILSEEMLRVLLRVLRGVEIFPGNMERNLALSQGAMLAERIVNLLITKGVQRQEAHDRVRRISMQALDSKTPFYTALQEDKFVSKRLKRKAIKESLYYKT